MNKSNTEAIQIYTLSKILKNTITYNIHTDFKALKTTLNT